MAYPDLFELSDLNHAGEERKNTPLMSALMRRKMYASRLMRYWPTLTQQYRVWWSEARRTCSSRFLYLSLNNATTHHWHTGHANKVIKSNIMRTVEGEANRTQNTLKAWLAYKVVSVSPNFCSDSTNISCSTVVSIIR